MKLWLKGKDGRWEFNDNANMSDLARRDITVGKFVTIGYMSMIGDKTTIGDMSTIGNGVKIGNGTTIGDRAMVGDFATVAKTLDCIVVGPIGSRNSMLTGYLRDRQLCIGTGYFTGTLEDFRKEVNDKHGGTDIGRDYLSALDYVESRMKIALKA